MTEESELQTLKREFEEFQRRESARGFTIMRGVWAACVPLIPFVIGILLWAINVNENQREAKIEINHLKSADARHEKALDENRIELVKRLDRIDTALDLMGKQLAKIVK